MRQYVTARDAACKIQAVARGRAQHKRYLTLRSAAVTLQRVVRGRKERVVWNQIQSASLLVQTFIRAAEQRRNFLGILLFPFLFFSFFKISLFFIHDLLSLVAINQAATIMQTAVSVTTACKSYRTLKAATIVFQSVSGVEVLLFSSPFLVILF